MQVSKIHTEDTPPELAPLKIELHRIVCEVGCLLKQIARHDQRYKSLQRVSVDALCILTEPVRWGYECKTVRYYGKTYHFTDSQAEVIRVLKKRRELGLPRIHERSICTKALALLQPEAGKDEVGR